MKRTLSIALAMLCILALGAGAASALDGQPSSLTVAIRYADAPLDGIEVAVCRAADARLSGGRIVLEAVQAFAGAGVDFPLNLSSQENIAMAAKLNSYAAANGIARSVKVTQNGGKAVFTGLSAGLYLVAQTNAQASEYTIDPYMVMVPRMDTASGKWDHNVVAYPKTEPVKRGDANDSVSVCKVWAGTETPPASGILVQLYRNGVPYGNCVTLSANNQWRYTWKGLDPKSSWSIDEFDIPEGYSKSISGSTSGGYVLTNTKDSGAPERIMISGSKTWQHGSNPASKQPASIVLQFRANGVLILQKQVGEAEHWSWRVRMDKYDKNGKEIVYTIDEAPVADYVKLVDGYNLINAHTSVKTPGGSSSGGSGGNGGPKTDDTSSPLLWLGLIGISITGLAATLVVLIKAKRREKNEAVLHAVLTMNE